MRTAASPVYDLIRGLIRGIATAHAPRAAGLAAIERWLERERDQLVLWVPVMLGLGIAAWFAMGRWQDWALWMLVTAAISAGALALDRGGRAGRVLALAALAAMLGMALIWGRAVSVTAPPLDRAVVAQFTARVEKIEPLAARDLVRLRLAPCCVAARGSTAERLILPAHIRVNLRSADVPAGLTRGAVIALRARLLPPPDPALPGAYDYARVAWFDGIGATGRGFAPVRLIRKGPSTGALRQRLSAHIQAQLPGSAGAVAAALATGDQGAIGLADAEAMRRAGLAHLLSVSGLHITAVVGGVMAVVMRLLALWPWAARAIRLPLVAAAVGAAAAVGYTVLTGAEVPTVRSCIAALLVLLALALGREAVTLRLVAAGAVMVLLLWPEALAGPSFQLSFAAVGAIVALHESPRVRAWFARRDEGVAPRLARLASSLLLTGVVVEAVLAPIALFHFHKAGLYGALANIVAIPLTTFVIMPLEALALAADLGGVGAPFWWGAGRALDALLGIAHLTAAAPGAVTVIPTMPGGAFALMIGGMLWCGLWRTQARWAGAIPIAAGILWTLATPFPDVLVTGDGRHMALRTSAGDVAMLRTRSGDYTQTMLAENGGVDGLPVPLDESTAARCSADLCLAERVAGGRRWRILATRSAYRLDGRALNAACQNADIVVSDRRLPRGCRPRWLKLDPVLLSRTGGVAITLSTGRVTPVRQARDDHPWREKGKARFSRSAATGRKASLAPAPGRGDNAADHSGHWRGQAAPSRRRAGNI